MLCLVRGVITIENNSSKTASFTRFPNPIAYPHVNLKQLFSNTQGLPKRYGMAEALQLAGLPLEGTHHRGIDDARNIAKLLPYILGRKQLNLSTVQSIHDRHP